jgi:hypothetical protein
MRDRKSYCGVLLDDTNRKPICRFRFSDSGRRLGLFNAEKNEEVVPIATLQDIFAFAGQIKETVRRYEGLDVAAADSAVA